MKLINAKKSVVCVISEISYKPKGYELIETISCLKCAQSFCIYGSPNTTHVKSVCPHCEAPFELIISLP